ncbi:MAG: hypothetical protein ACYCUM_13675 [Solirubrobacteraceae bacterium]
MARGFWRIVFCLLLFGLGCEALHGLGEGVAVVLSGIVALAGNYLWREQQRKQLAREHREQVEADTETRIATAQRVLDVMSREPPASKPEA